MTPVTRQGIALGARVAASIFLLSLLAGFRALNFPLFYLGFCGAMLLGFLVARRVGRNAALVDAALIYFALFLLPPGVMGLAISFPWMAVSLAAALLSGLAAWRLSDRRVAPWETALAVLAILSAGATLNAFAMKPGDMPTAWAGYPALLEDAGIEDATIAPKLTTFPARRKIGELPEPVPHGDPPIGRVFGILERGKSEFFVRWFRHAEGVELNPRFFRVGACSPIRDIAFDRGTREWMILCGATGELARYGDDGAALQIFDLPGIWPFRIAIHQELERLYVIDPATGKLHELDLTTGDQLREPRVGFGISDVAVSPDGLELYIAQPYRARVIVLDAVTLETRTEIDLAFGVAHLAVDQARKRIYAVTLPRGTLFSLNPTTHEVVAETSLKSPVLDAAFDDATGRLYWATPKGMRWSTIGELFRAP
jgi:hypothetical protein